ncbi:MAG: GIY-YIG nuclease family protein [Ignavibacteriae bacterium]|nr:GIY-YIG nuclease family protein [Ignavibacteriota bacterium]
MYYTYILKSIKNGRLYIGHTENLDKRLKEHNTNQSKSTKGKGPWGIIYSKEFKTRSDAMIYEMKLKKIKNTNYLLNNLDNI